MSSYQKHLLAIVSEQLPEGVKLVDFLSELVHLSKEACYRRIRCEVEFTLSEVVVIAKELNINLTSLVIREGGDKVTCNLRVIEEDTLANSYIKRLEADLNVLEGFESKNNHSILFVCKELPEWLYFGSHGLMKLRLLKMQLNQDNLNRFTFDKVELSSPLWKIQRKYWDALREFKVILYLGNDILIGLINDVNYFFKTNLLTEENRQEILLDLLGVLTSLNDIAKTGQYKNKSIELYISNITLDFSQVYLKSEGLEATVLELNYPHTLLSFDQAFIKTHTQYLNVIRRTSTLISQSSEIEKTAYLNKLRELLMSMI